MSLFGRRSEKLPTGWEPLESVEQFEQLLKDSTEAFVLFKHSTRCHISSMAKNRLEQQAERLAQATSTYYVDVIQHRSVSNAIAQQLGVTHESPQVLCVKDGAVVYHTSHNGIVVDQLLAAINDAA